LKNRRHSTANDGPALRPTWPQVYSWKQFEGDLMARCLVTGGGGFIGSHLVEALLQAGHTVRVLDDFCTGKRANLDSVAGRIETLSGSVTDAAAVAGAMADIDWVFHLAALPSVQRSVEDPVATHDVCATGTLRVLEAARHDGARRVVYAASSSAYGDNAGTVRSETEALSPLSPYAAAKVAGEHYCRSFTRVYGLETVRLRFFNIFGPRQDPDSPYAGVIAAFARTMLAGRAPTIFGDGLQSRDFTYVANAVQALCNAAAATSAAGNVYNVGAGGRHNLLDLVHHLNVILGTSLEPVFAPPRSGDVRHSQADISLACRDLGYAPAVDFPEGLRRTVNWLRSH
jgi:UDP-glucose 4-epimerase